MYRDQLQFARLDQSLPQRAEIKRLSEDGRDIDSIADREGTRRFVNMIGAPADNEDLDWPVCAGDGFEQFDATSLSKAEVQIPRRLCHAHPALTNQSNRLDLKLLAECRLAMLHLRFHQTPLLGVHENGSSSLGLCQASWIALTPTPSFNWPGIEKFDADLGWFAPNDATKTRPSANLNKIEFFWNSDWGFNDEFGASFRIVTDRAVDRGAKAAKADLRPFQ